MEARIDVKVGNKPSQDETLPESQIAQVEAALPTGVLFSPPYPNTTAAHRPPDLEWELIGAWSYQGLPATGTAHVYFGQGHSELRRPLILADGFRYGPSDMPGLYDYLNTPYTEGQPGLLDELRQRGHDVILLGFGERHTYIQANAGVAASCIFRAIAESVGDEDLTVGGISMGGLITRYALARLERNRMDHRTARYFSLDSPHNGAWVPLILQQLAYFSEKYGKKPEPGQPSQADLIKSPAAQQLLWAWVPSEDYSGPVATASPLRAQFLEDLRAVGWFPMRPIKLGMASGRGDGTGNGVPAGAQVFDWNGPLGVQATALTQPDGGVDQYIGGKKILWRANSTTTAVPAHDGAPGGTLDSFKLVAEELGIEIDPVFENTCFVPTISAVAASFDPVAWPMDLTTRANDLDPDQYDLDAFVCDETNSPHGLVTEPLATWFLNQLGK
ncbi:esterase/lipase family protein [Actinomadura harenae]|uniref:DUF676 domain-containing protein n=1 Tax=Actinomadura harenae TaxID=2483351 RepID=A0A3M2LQE7_9ACTN|nr:hypothetical protein [Actinomadura harenae]RMI39691.1 hypothetical protein EBO15_28860 [Actinomadura harenae]